MQRLVCFLTIWDGWVEEVRRVDLLLSLYIYCLIIHGARVEFNFEHDKQNVPPFTHVPPSILCSCRVVTCRFCVIRMLMAFPTWSMALICAGLVCYLTLQASISTMPSRTPSWPAEYPPRFFFESINHNRCDLVSNGRAHRSIERIDELESYTQVHLAPFFTFTSGRTSSPSLKRPYSPACDQTPKCTLVPTDGRSFRSRVTQTVLLQVRGGNGCPGVARDGLYYAEVRHAEYAAGVCLRQSAPAGRQGPRGGIPSRSRLWIRICP